MKIVKMYETEISSANVLRVAAGTTGYCGGDSGHGGRTFIELADLAGTDIQFSVSGPNKRSLEIKLGGDTELSTIIEAFEFVVTTLRRELQKTIERA